MGCARLTLAILLVIFFAPQLLAKPPLEESWEKTYSLGAQAEISLRNTDGTVSIYGSEVKELKLYVRKRAYSRERLQAIAIKVSVTEAKVTIETIMPPQPKGLSLRDRSGTVDYMLLVPQTATIAELGLTNGEIILSGLRGPAVHARLTNGLIWALDCFSALDLSARQGGLEILFNWWEPGAVSLRATLDEGNLHLALPPEASVHLEATSRTGQIFNQFGAKAGPGDEHHLQTTIGPAPGAEFKLQTDSGNIKIEKAY